MRLAIVSYSVVIIAIGVFYLLLYGDNPDFFDVAIYTIPLGFVNLALGVATAKSGGVDIPSNPQDPVKMIVDRGVVGSAIYVIAFSRDKLVLKKLSSGRVTILPVITFAIAGLLLTGSYLGIAIGGLTAFSLQEFLTQRKRNATRRGNLLTLARGDLEFSYRDIEKICLTKSRLRLYLQKGIMGIVISRKYPAIMKPVLEKIVPSLLSDKN